MRMINNGYWARTRRPSTACVETSTGQSQMKSKCILLHPKDNVLVCCRQAGAGEIILAGNDKIVLMQDMELGHKVARQAIANGGKIIKYGVSIGSAMQDILPGEHVHLHNMRSDYIPPHTRQPLQEISNYK